MNLPLVPLPRSAPTAGTPNGVLASPGSAATPLAAATAATPPAGANRRAEEDELVKKANAVRVRCSLDNAYRHGQGVSRRCSRFNDGFFVWKGDIPSDIASTTPCSV